MDLWSCEVVLWIMKVGETAFFFFSSRRRHTRCSRDWSSDVCSSDLVLSPGPRTPGEAGILVPLVQALAGKLPVLGVCLGHQAIGEAFGARVVRADRLMHGKTCEVVHEEDELFEGVPSPVTGMRYHSLVVEPASLPKDLVITAWSADRPKDAEIMAMKHRRHPIYGVQFHPESIGTSHGRQLLENFLRIAHATG